MTEAELDAQVRQLLCQLGLFGYHVHDSRRSAAGWPDWVIVGRTVLYRELKSETGGLSPEQRRVRNLLLAADADWALWRPSDLRSGRIHRELAAASRRAGGSSDAR